MAIKKEVKEEAEEIKKAVEGKEPQLTDLPGIGPAVSAKLESAGVFDMMSLAVMSPATLSDAAGVSSAVARKAIQAARTMLDLGFQDGVEYAKKRSNVSHIITGSKELDNLLGGKGVESRAITEAFGAYGSGKCVSKDTLVSYFNDTRMHVESIEKTYEKYNGNNEFKFEEGTAIPVNTIKVLSLVGDELKVVNASHLYRERVKNIFIVKTKRGRVLKITGKHQFLSFNKGINWKQTKSFNIGDLIACPREINLETENVYDKEDAYFLGLFVAEGSSNPFSISTGSEEIKNWVVNYLVEKFGYSSTVRIDNRREKPVYTILLMDNTRVLMDGVDRCNSGNKFIPEGIFLSNKEVVSSFLGGYFDGDAEVSSNDISVTTKSERLASQLTYLLLRLGISTSVRDKIVDDKLFKIVRISGEDRIKLKNINFLIKKFECSIRNSAYGYPDKIVDELRELYKKSIGGNRGRQRKLIGKSDTNMADRHLTRNSFTKVINSKTLDQVELIFLRQGVIFREIISDLNAKKLTNDLLKSIYPKLPFAFNSLSIGLGVAKNSIGNYISRNLPDEKKDILKRAIVKELEFRLSKISLALDIIFKIRNFRWDIVESIEAVHYDDYVYDFVVPEGHSFVGGNMPTLMHNTQLGSTLAVNVQLPVDKGGANGKCVFIDTEGTFRPQRIKQIAEGLGANPEKVLKNILVARAFNSLPADEEVFVIDKGKYSKAKIGDLVKEGKKDLLTFSFDSNGKMSPCRITDYVAHRALKNEEVYLIKTKYGREINVTGFHSLFKGVRKGKGGKSTVRRIKNNMRPEVVEACSLKIGDYIAISGFLPMIEKEIKEFDLHEKMKNFSKSLRNEIRKTKEGIELKHTGRRDIRNVPKKVKVDKDLLWLLGFAIAEGSAQYKNRMTRIRFSSETVFLEKAKKIIQDKFLVDGFIYEKEHTLLVSSRLVGLLFREIFGVDLNIYSSKRKIPEWIMQLPLEKLKYFLKGFWDGDGYHASNRRKNRIIYHTSSRELANDLSFALLRYGILGAIHEISLKSRKDYKTHWGKHYRVEAAGLENNDFINLEKIKQKLNSPVWNDLVFAQIKSIEARKIKKNEIVYDFEVYSKDKPYQNFLAGFGGVSCHNSDHQILLLEKVTEMIKNGEPIKLLIVDSLTAHFRAEFAGRGQLADRQQKLNRYMHDLMKLAEQHNLAVYVTNQVMANPAQMFGDPTTAIGGNIVGHASTYRMYLRRGKQGSRVSKLIDSPNLPDNEAIFWVTDSGVCDG